jgi:hypothetical protein
LFPIFKIRTRGAWPDVLSWLNIAVIWTILFWMFNGWDQLYPNVFVAL